MEIRLSNMKREIDFLEKVFVKELKASGIIILKENSKYERSSYNLSTMDAEYEK